MIEMKSYNVFSINRIQIKNCSNLYLIYTWQYDITLNTVQKHLIGTIKITNIILNT